MWRTSTQNKGRYGTPGDGPSGPFFTPEACPDESRTDKAVRPAGPPPLGPYLVRGSQSGPRLRAPPAGRASAPAGDPNPWPAPAAFNIRRAGMRAARTAATLILRGVVWRPARRSGAGSSVLYCRRWGKGRPPGGRWLRRYRLDQVCALVESACLRPRRRGAAPAPPGAPGGDGGSITVRKGV